MGMPLMGMPLTGMPPSLGLAFREDEVGCFVKLFTCR